MTIYFLKFPLQTSLGGGEIYTLALAKHYQQLGHEVRLFTSDALLFRLFEKHDLPRKRLFFGWEPTAKWSLLLWPLTYLIARHKLKKILKIHTGQTGSIEHICHGLTEKLILTPMVAKTIWIEHKIPGRWLKWSPLKFRYLKLAKQAKLVTVSEFAKSEFIKLGVPEKNIQVIYPSPTSLPWHGEGLREGSQNFTIGILGRLDPEKGIIEFLRSVIPALGRNPSWKILIAGEGPEKNQIQHNQISYLGFIYDLDEFFSQISVLAYPSKVPESFGMAAAEAVSRGVPVIASKIGALPELIQHEKTGYLVEQPDEWIKYLEQLTHDRGLVVRIDTPSAAKPLFPDLGL